VEIMLAFLLLFFFEIVPVCGMLHYTFKFFLGSKELFGVAGLIVKIVYVAVGDR
jgi:hypothetical protein